MPKRINDEEWNHFVNTNEVSDEILQMIIYKIVNCFSLNEREIMIYSEKSEKIERIIKIIQKKLG